MLMTGYMDGAIWPILWGGFTFASIFNNLHLFLYKYMLEEEYGQYLIRGGMMHMLARS